MKSVYDPSGKFQRVSSGEMQLPAVCASCGVVANVDGFVDTKLDYEFYGVVYFCCDCAFELTTVFPEAPYHTMRQRIQLLEQDIVAKDARIASLDRSLDGLTAARLSERGIAYGTSDAELFAESKSDDVTSDDAEGAGDDDPVLTESITDDGPVLPTKPQRRDPILTDVN